MNSLITFLNTTGKTFIDFSTPMLIQSSVLIIVLLVLDLLLRKKVRAVFRYCIWMLVLVKLVLPTTLASPTGLGYWFGDSISGIVSEKPLVTEQTAPILPGIEPVSETVPPETAITALPQVSTSHKPIANIPVESAITASSVTASLSWQGFAFLGWLAVVIAMALLLIQRMFFVRGLLAQSKDPSDSMIGAFHHCQQQMKIREKVNLKLSPVAASPSVCGLFRPTILIPQNLPSKLNREDLRSILLHELAHIKRGDLAISLVQTILQIAYFYNPLLWMANAIIRKVREQAVDEMVLVAMGERAEDYPETLLNISRLTFSRPALSLRLIGVVESKKALSGRIKHILSRPFPKTAKLGFVGLLAIIITASILLPMAKAEKSKETTDVAQQQSEFKATLPNGVTVKLVGVCNYPSKDKQWWKPDGSQLDMKIITEDKSRYTSDYPGYEIAFKVVGEDFNFKRGKIKDSKESSNIDIIEPEGIIACRAHIKKGIKQTKITAGAAAGKWNTIATHNGHGITSKTFKGKKIILSAANESKNGLVMTITDNICFTEAARLIAIDKNGSTFTGNMQTGLSDSGLAQSTFIFANLSLNSIKEFQFQIRPYEYVTFKNVSLKPDFKTDVQVVAEDVEKADYSSVTVKEGVGFDNIIFGCTGDSIKSKLGGPDKELHNEKDWWLNYRKTYGLGFWVNPQENYLIEIRLNPGFKGKLSSGISMSSAKKDVFDVYGEPVTEIATSEFDERYDNQVLLKKQRFIGRPKISKIYYNQHGLLFWFEDDKINQIVVSRKETAGQIEAEKAKPLSETKKSEYKQRYFVTIIAGSDKDKLCYQGQQITWEELEDKLSNPPNKEVTVLEVAYEPGMIPSGRNSYDRNQWLENNEAFKRAGQLVKELGLEYLSFVGQDHPSTRRGPVSIRTEGKLKLNEEIPVGLQSFEEQPLLNLKSVVFDRNLRATLKFSATSYPHKLWEIGIRLLDERGHQINSVVKTYDNKGIARGIALNYVDEIEFNFNRTDIKAIDRFEVKLREFEKPQTPAGQVDITPVDFEITKQGFLQDDSIEITEVLGTGSKFEVGQTYTIKGKYKLSSHDQAMLHIYATNGETRSKQGPIVKRGTGEFTRTFTYIKEGWLHLSFYPADGGSSFGNLYFAEKGSNQQVPNMSGITSVVGEAKSPKQKPTGATMLQIIVQESTGEGKDEIENVIALSIPLASLKAGNMILPKTAESQMNKYGITIEEIIKMIEDGTAPMSLLELEEDTKGESGEILHIETRILLR
ncbi:MAG: M56 family metallopeptidase [Planctomycetota bacterium]